MSSNFSVYCRKCSKYFPGDERFDEAIHTNICPECNGQGILDRHSMEENIKSLRLSKSEIGEKVALLKKQY